MGALHAGHASLIRAARAACTHVAVSLFVNPTQFGPNEDFGRYPRSFEADCALAASEGADVLFAPTVEELYPNGPAPPSSRSRLSAIASTAHPAPAIFAASPPSSPSCCIAAEPDLAFFGQKDAAQVAVLRRMVADLRLATEIVVCPIVRDADGLALSSRNAYLNAAERAQALTLSRAVRHVESLVAQGERRADVLIAAARQVFAAEPADPHRLHRARRLGHARARRHRRSRHALRRRRLGWRNATHRQHDSCNERCERNPLRNQPSALQSDMQCRNSPTSPPIITALEPRILGQKLERVRLQSVFVLRTADPPITAVEGRTVRDLRRIGKRIAIGLDAGPDAGPDSRLWLVLHLMIAGRLHWRPPQAKLSGRQSLFAFDFPTGSLVLTEAGSKRRASLHLLRGEQALRDIDPGGIEIFSSRPSRPVSRRAHA